ncbi:uncharacterized protein [Amphiura filiformis]|uniref:uncharacterized protein n=1 Tax=Amphiura filiformis TaxID=82378 RepID=UPI003B227A55
MKLNPEKCAYMSISFLKRPLNHVLKLCNTDLNQVDVTKILGVHISADLTWSTHIDQMLKKANGRLHMLKLLKRFDLPIEDLVTIYVGYVRPLTEYVAPVWHSSITAKQQSAIERVQKRACKIILGNKYFTYDEALTTCNLTVLTERRKHICVTFVNAMMSSHQFREWLPPLRGSSTSRLLRNSDHLTTVRCRTKRYQESPIPYLTKLYNDQLM